MAINKTILTTGLVAATAVTVSAQEKLYDNAMQLFAVDEKIANVDAEQAALGGIKDRKEKKELEKYKDRLKDAAAKLSGDIKSEQKSLGLSDKKLAAEMATARADYESGFYTKEDKEGLVSAALGSGKGTASFDLLDKYAAKADKAAEGSGKSVNKRSSSGHTEKGKFVKDNKTVNCMGLFHFKQRTYLPMDDASVTLNNFFVDAKRIVWPEKTASIGWEQGSQPGNFTFYAVDENYNTLAIVAVNNARATAVWHNKQTNFYQSASGRRAAGAVLNGGIDIVTGQKTAGEAGEAMGRAIANELAGLAGDFSNWKNRFEQGSPAQILDFMGTMRGQGSLNPLPILPNSILMEMRAEQGSIDRNNKAELNNAGPVQKTAEGMAAAAWRRNAVINRDRGFGEGMLSDARGTTLRAAASQVASKAVSQPQSNTSTGAESVSHVAKLGKAYRPQVQVYKPDITNFMDEKGIAARKQEESFRKKYLNEKSEQGKGERTV